MKAASAIVAASLLSGCHAMAYVAAHKEGIGLFALGAGAVASGESAVSGAWDLVDRARNELREKP